MRSLVPPATCQSSFDAASAAASEALHALHLPPLPQLPPLPPLPPLPALPVLAPLEPPPLVLRALQHLGLDRRDAESGTFYDLEAMDALGARVDFHDFIGKVVLVVNVAPHDSAAEKYYEELRALCEEFGSLPGQPFRLLLLPCDQFLSLRQRWKPPQLLDDAGQLAFAAQHGLLPPTVRVLSKGNVNGPDASPVWRWLKVAYRDTSDIGGNHGKWLVRSDGTVYCRYTPQLVPSLLQPAISRLVEEGRREGRCLAETQAEEGRAAAPACAAAPFGESAEMVSPPSWHARASGGAEQPEQAAVTPRSAPEL